MMPFNAMRLRKQAGGVDPYFASVISLLHFDNNWTDVTGKVWTPQNTPLFDASNKLFGSHSGVFAGGGSDQHISTPDHADWDLGTSDFCIEGWSYFTVVSGNEVVLAKAPGAGAFAPFLVFRVGNDLQFYASSNGTSWDIVSALSFGVTLAQLTGYRWSITRSGNNFYTHMDGVYGNTASSSGSLINNSADVRIASYDGVSFAMSGNVDEFRATRSARGRTNANYTLDAAAFPDS